MEKSSPQDRLQAILNQFVDERQKHLEDTRAGFSRTKERWLRASKVYPMLQKKDSEFLSRMQYLLQKEIAVGSITMEDLRDFLVFLKGHVLRLQE